MLLLYVYGCCGVWATIYGTRTTIYARVTTLCGCRAAIHMVMLPFERENEAPHSTLRYFRTGTA
eukprot:3940481-Rhodomonas_salina.15